LVAGGLAFLDRDRRPLRTAWGAMMLGCAFASHAIDGAMGLTTAAVAIRFASIDGDFANPAREALCLVGALMLAIPEFAVALMIRLSYPILPACQIAGVGVIAIAARGVAARSEPRAAARWLQRALIAAALGMIAFFPSDIINGLRGGFPLLTWLCVGGLLMAATTDYKHSGGIWIAAVALALADTTQYLIAAAIHVFQNQHRCSSE
jgi:hypothetical protein